MKRPSLTSIQLSMLVTAFVLSTANATFWMKAWTYLEEFPGALAGFAVAIFLLGASLLTMFSMKYVIKPVFILFVLIAAVSSYYVDTFGIVVDRDAWRDPTSAMTFLAPEARAATLHARAFRSARDVAMSPAGVAPTPAAAPRCASAPSALLIGAAIE